MTTESKGMDFGESEWKCIYPPCHEVRVDTEKDSEKPPLCSIHLAQLDFVMFQIWASQFIRVMRPGGGLVVPTGAAAAREVAKVIKGGS